MEYKNIKKDTYIGERALFSLHDAIIDGSTFKDGESPLKECSNLIINNVSFEWKYPLWYSENITVSNTKFLLTARSGIWYTKNITINNSLLECPKTFRRSENIVLENVEIPNGEETLWNCNHIVLKNVKVKGDYLGFNSSYISIDNLYLDGNYAFDGAKNIIINNSTLLSKDSFWNSENVVIKNSKIVGEYLAWNSKNITFINCEIESHQGLCYINKVKLINCKLISTDLCFELCSHINAEIINEVDSIKNPLSGKIKVKNVKELILDDKFCNPKKTSIIIGNKK